MLLLYERYTLVHPMMDNTHATYVTCVCCEHVRVMLLLLSRLKNVLFFPALT